MFVVFIRTNLLVIVKIYCPGFSLKIVKFSQDRQVDQHKKILHKLISPWQIAFVPGRKIQENTFLAQEIIHDMKKKRKGKTSWMGIKIDMEKAYDRVKWKFLARVISQFQELKIVYFINLIQVYRKYIYILIYTGVNTNVTT